uniref:Uncharacterized protein n=1 Tax=Tanacetum cinerariifolium TaxID=118510 RepID=A0A6L2MDV5_TANCI|nr:hypothetical protein [Tanacetum cinerariifolium]
MAPPPHNVLVSFLKQLGYKGSLELLLDLYVDHMYQPRRTFTTIINKCLSGKTSDIEYQIDYKQTSAKRRENMPYPRFTNIIIDYFLSKHKSIPKRHNSVINTIKDDGVLGKLKQRFKGKKATIIPGKKGSISAEDNIILDPNVALKIRVSKSLTEAEEQDEQRRVHENHERLVIRNTASDEVSKEEGLGTMVYILLAYPLGFM